MQRIFVTMFQKPEELRQARFMEFVNSLLLRFPNKEIVKRTGYKSGIVSEYLRGKKTVSESFLRVFCEKFGADFNYLMGLDIELNNGNASTPDKMVIQISQRHLLI